MDHWSKKLRSDFLNRLTLLNYQPGCPEEHLKDGVWTFCLIKQLLHNLSKIWTYLFWPMVHWCKKCVDISKVTYGGRAKIENVKNDMLSDLHFNLRQQMLFLICYLNFYIYGALGKKAFCRILKRLFITWITGHTVQNSQICAFFAP